MNDERLGHQRFHEPTCMEKCRGIRLVRGCRMREAPGQLRRRRQPNLAALEYKPHHRISAVVEYGTDRADENDELRDLPDVPWTRAADRLGADIVCRDRNLGINV